MTEREFKLLVDPQLTTLALDLLIDEARVVVLARETRQQQDRYFDTKALALAASGAALRTRQHGEGAKICWKGRGRVEGALHEREEIEIDWPTGAEPRRAAELPPSLRDRVEPFTLREKLRAVLTLATTRQIRRCGGTDGRESFEVVLDEVVAEDGAGARHEFREVEIEGDLPLGGHARRLHEILIRRAGARASESSKLERALAGCAIELPPRRRATAFPSGETRAGDGARELLLACNGHLADQELLVRTAADSEAVHKMRVACRRLRSTLRLVADVYSKRQREPIESAMQVLGQALGRVRDLDVRASELAGLEPALPPTERERLRRVRTTLDLVRAEELAKLREWLASDARLASAERANHRLYERPDGARADAELLPFLRSRIARLAEDVFSRGDALTKTSSPSEVHDLRIAIKRLRYALEFGSELLPGEYQEVAKRAAKLQGWLGTYNDAITAQMELPERIPLQDDEDLALAYALALQRREGHKARKRFVAAWPEFAPMATRELFSC